MHTAAREMVYVAEQGLGADKTLDQTWQEMLNHATAKVSALQATLLLIRVYTWGGPCETFFFF